MNLNFLCCIGAEMKNSTTQTTRMSQVYIYRAFEGESVADMLTPGFFNQALGILRADDLLLLYGPNDELSRWVYARVVEITRDGVIVEKIDIQAQDVYVDTTGFKNIVSTNLQDIMVEIDANITRLDERIDEEIARATAAEGDLNLPVITEGGTAPTNLSQAIRELNEQEIAEINPSDQAPTPGTWTLWNAIRKCFANIVNFFNDLVVVNARLNALEGRGGPVGAYDFGKAMENPISAADEQVIVGVMIDNIWPGHTAVDWKTPLYESTFTDASGIDRTAGDIFNATWIRNSFDGTRLVLTNTPDTDPRVFGIDNVGVDVVGFANETTAGIVRTGSGSDMITDQTTGDISIDNSKGFSIWNRITALFTKDEQAIIRQNLGLSVLIPVSTIWQYTGKTLPDGWAWCDGTEVRRAGIYAALFAEIGTDYGAGQDWYAWTADGTTNYTTSETPAVGDKVYATWPSTEEYGTVAQVIPAKTETPMQIVVNITGETPTTITLDQDSDANQINATFNLPDFTDRVAQGGFRGYREAGLPDITGTFGGTASYTCTGAFYSIATVYNSSYDKNVGFYHRNTGFAASRSNAIYGASPTVQPPACGINFIIKY